MADLKLLIDNVRTALDELEAGAETGDTEEMETEETMEDDEMGEERKAMRGMRPKKQASMDEYFSTKG